MGITRLARLTAVTPHLAVAHAPHLDTSVVAPRATPGASAAAQLADMAFHGLPMTPAPAAGTIETSLRENSRRALAVYEAHYGLLNSHDPDVARIQKIFNNVLTPVRRSGKTLPDLRLFVGAEDRRLTAFSLADGAIVLSLPMINLAETDDELAFLLSHEMTHAIREHVRQRFDNSQSDTLVEQAGRPRAQEWEADLIGTVSIVSEAGYHPLAGAVFFRRLQEAQQQEGAKIIDEPDVLDDDSGEEGEAPDDDEGSPGDSWSISHGTLQERILNIMTLPMILDFPGTRQEHQVIDGETRHALADRVAALPAVSSFEQSVSDLKNQTDGTWEKFFEEMAKAPALRHWLIAKEVLSELHDDLGAALVQHVKKSIAPDPKAPLWNCVPHPRERTGAQLSPNPLYRLIKPDENLEEIHTAMERFLASLYHRVLVPRLSHFSSSSSVAVLSLLCAALGAPLLHRGMDPRTLDTLRQQRFRKDHDDRSDWETFPIFVADFNMAPKDEEPLYVGETMTMALSEGLDEALALFQAALDPIIFQRLGAQDIMAFDMGRVWPLITFCAAPAVALTGTPPQPIDIPGFFKISDGLHQQTAALMDALGHPRPGYSTLTTWRLKYLTSRTPVSGIVRYYRRFDQQMKRPPLQSLLYLYGTVRLMGVGKLRKTLVGVVRQLPASIRTARLIKFLVEPGSALQEFVDYLIAHGPEALFEDINSLLRPLPEDQQATYLGLLTKGLIELMTPLIKSEKQTRMNFDGPTEIWEKHASNIEREFASEMDLDVEEVGFQHIRGGSELWTSPDNARSLLTRWMDLLLQEKSLADCMHHAIMQALTMTGRLEPADKFLDRVERTLHRLPDFKDTYQNHEIFFMSVESVVGVLRSRLSEGAAPATVIDELVRFNSSHFIDALTALTTSTGVSMRERTRLIASIQQLFVSLRPGLAGDPKRLLETTTLMTDPDIRGRIREFAVAAMVPTLNFEDACRLVFGLGTGTASQAHLTHRIELLIEDKAVGPDELEELKSHFLDFYQRHGTAAVGKQVMMEGLFKFLGNRSEDVLAAAIESGRDETLLIRLLLEGWWDYFYTKGSFREALKPNTLFTLNKQHQILEWLDEKIPILDGMADAPHDFHLLHLANVSDSANRLYSASSLQRHQILRRLLTEPDTGILHSPEKTAAVIKHYLAVYVDASPAAHTLLNEIATAAVSTGSVEELYFMLAPLLVDSIFQRPPQRAKTRGIVRRHISQFPYAGYKTPSTPWLTDLAQEVTMNRESARPLTLKTHGDALTEKTRRWSMHGAIPSDQLVFAERAVLDSLPPEYRTNPTLGKQSLIQTIKAAALSFRGPGVRLLQLLFLYLDIDPDIESEFAEIHDNVRGQAKIAAYETIRRESPERVRPGDELGARIGGGSQVTAYKRHSQEDKTTVLKVLNPNAELFVGEKIDFMYRIVDRLLEQDPENPIYLLAKHSLLPDLEEWMLADINDIRYPENDETFRKARFHAEIQEGPHRMIVPESEGSASYYLQEEDLIPGINLTDVTLGESDDFAQGIVTAKSYRAIVRTIARHYIAQIRSSLGLVHSDVHGGNFRLMADGRIAILDRHFYLEFDETDRKFLKSFLAFGISLKEAAALATRGIEGVARSRLTVLIDYLLTDPRNEKLRKQRQALINDLLAFIRSHPDGFNKLASPAGLSGLIVQMRMRRLRFPIRLTLLMKNLKALDKMARRAGYRDLVEAVR